MLRKFNSIYFTWELIGPWLWFLFAHTNTSKNTNITKQNKQKWRKAMNKQKEEGGEDCYFYWTGLSSGRYVSMVPHQRTKKE